MWLTLNTYRHTLTPLKLHTLYKQKQTYQDKHTHTKLLGSVYQSKLKNILERKIIIRKYSH